MQPEILDGIKYYATRIRHAQDGQLAGWVKFARTELDACHAARDITKAQRERAQVLLDNAATYRRAELMRELIA